MNATDPPKLTARPWNPFTGCSRVSPACQNCYAETLSLKLQRWGTAGYEMGFEFVGHPERIRRAEPLRRRKPSLYFINSMSDTFHEEADEGSINAVMDVVTQTPRHHFYLLTKRSGRMRDYFTSRVVPDNLWLGVTVEDRKHGFPRFEDLHRIKAPHKHICCEPLLEDLGDLDLSGVKLVVGGGESGPKGRRTELQWVESLQRQCEKQGVHFYWKQWGRYGEDGVARSKANNGFLVNGKPALSFPQELMP